jgi:hypothetical protein
MRFFWAWLGLGTLTVACSAEPEGHTCGHSETRPCVGATNCRGVQRCQGAAPAWSTCECTGSGGEGGSGGRSETNPANSGTAGQNIEKPLLGSACESEADCPGGATCVGESNTLLFGGGPPLGMCLAECTEDPAICEAFADAVCVAIDDASDAAYCFRACTYGAAALDKCGRADTACESLDGDLGFCRPLCMRNEQCRSDYCDRTTGVCVEAGSADGAFGRACGLSSESTPPATSCPGVCVRFNGGDFQVCSHRCVYGATDSCAGDGETAGLCAIASPGGSVGDLGYCAELCDCDGACAHQDARCDAFTSERVRDLLGHAGVCVAPESASSVAAECTEP